MQIYCFGEMLIDLLARRQGVPLEQVESFDRAGGGAPANVARDLAELGVEVLFMGLVGDDPFGRFLAGGLEKSGVSTEWLSRSRHVSTPLAFLATLTDGSKQVSFAGMNSWARRLAELGEMDRAITPGPQRWLHVGGVASAWAELHHRQRALMTRARRAGWRTSLDANYRPALYANRADLFASRMAELIPLADVVKVAVEELEATLPGIGPASGAADRILAMGASVVALTRGPGGAMVKAAGSDVIDLPAVEAPQVEPTGAGDAFMAGLIAALARAAGTPPSPPGTPGASANQPPWPAEHELRFAAELANECGALAVTQVGAAMSLKKSPARTYPALGRWKKEMKSSAR